MRDVVAEEQCAGRARSEPPAEVVAAAAVVIITNLGQLHLQMVGPEGRSVVVAQVRAALGLLARGLRP